MLDADAAAGRAQLKLDAQKFGRNDGTEFRKEIFRKEYFYRVPFDMYHSKDSRQCLERNSIDMYPQDLSFRR